MARHLRIQVPEHVYWGVVALAEHEGLAQSAMTGELIAEALRHRAMQNPGGAPAMVVIDDEIRIAAGLEQRSEADMRSYLLSLGWWCWKEDIAEEGETALERMEARDVA